MFPFRTSKLENWCVYILSYPLNESASLYHATPNDWIFDTKNIMHSFSLYDVFLMVANVHFQRWCKRANLNAFFSIFISSLWHLIYDVRCDWITYCYSFKSNLCYQATSVHWIFERRYMISIIILSILSINLLFW